MMFLNTDNEEEKESTDEISSNSSEDDFDNLARQLRAKNPETLDENNPYLLPNNKIQTSKVKFNTTEEQTRGRKLDNLKKI